jgi:hypothetical protein
MIEKRILVGALAATALLACTGCTAQELAAMRASASNGDGATPAYMQTDTPFPPPPPISLDTPPPPMPTMPTGPALDPTNGHLLIPIGPNTYSDPTTGTLYPPGSAVIPQ